MAKSEDAAAIVSALDDIEAGITELNGRVTELANIMTKVLKAIEQQTKELKRRA